MFIARKLLNQTMVLDRM